MQITEPQARIALTNLMESGRVSEADVSRAISDEIAKAQARLAHIRGETAMVASTLAFDQPGPATKGRKRKAASPQQAESRRVQGVYMNLIRHVPKSRRDQYRAIAKQSGREAAIMAMRAARFH